MSETTGIYILEGFGLSDYDVAELMSVGKTLEELVRDVINTPQVYKDFELISAVYKFVKALPDSSMNLFQSIYMLRNFGLSSSDIKTLQQKFKIAYISDADYKMREIGKSWPYLLEKTKKAISEFKDWIITDAAVIAIYEFGLIYQHVDKSISASEVDGQIMALRYKLGVKKTLFASARLKGPINFSLSEVGISNLQVRVSEHRTPSNKFKGPNSRTIKPDVEKFERVVPTKENKREVAVEENKTTSASGGDEPIYDNPGLSRLLAYGATEKAVENIRQRGGTFFTVYGLAFSVKPLNGKAINYGDLDSSGREVYNRVMHLLRTRESRLNLEDFDSIFILNYFGASLELLRQLDEIGKSRVTDIVTINGWLRKAPKKLPLRWQHEYQQTIRRPVELFKKWMQSGAGYEEYTGFLHILVQQNKKYIPTNDVLKLANKMERLGVDIRQKPSEPTMNRTAPKSLATKKPKTVSKTVKPTLIWKGKKVSTGTELGDEKDEINLSTSFLSKDVLTLEEFNNKMTKRGYTSSVYVKRHFGIKEQDGFYFNARYASLGEVAMKKMPTYGLFDSIAETWMQKADVKEAIKALQRARLIFSIGDGKYVTLGRLQEVGVERSDIDDFVTDVTKKYDVFTIPMIINDGYSHKLINLGFENEFIESILLTSKAVVTLTSNIPIFSTDLVNRNKFNLLSVLQPFLDSDTHSIDIYDAINDLYDKYRIVITEPNLKNKVKNSNFEYSKETERIFENKEYMIEYIYRNK